ncbi:MAG: ABC transporter ATP-binding protein, partial [Acidimicrobiia bacterium]|nr:ABC transporter ATP-binding protein [Acidimicrobiia bacterium]
GGRVSLDVQYDLRTAIFERLQRLDLAGHDRMRTGQLVSRASSDVGLLQGILSFLPVTAGNIITLIVSLVVMAALSPLLTVVALVAVPALLIVMIRLRLRVFPASWDAQQRAGEVADVVEETVSGVRVVKGFGQERRMVEDLSDSAEDLFRSRARLVRIQARYTPMLQTIPTLSQVLVLILGGWLVIHDEITLGTFLAFASYLVQLVAPSRMLAGLLALGQQARAGAERVLDLLDSTSEVADRPGAEPLIDVRGEIAFDDISFGYLRAEPVLEGFSLHLAAGERVAVVGTSGSGKSTLALLLPRFYDVQQGSISVDGQDVRDVQLESLRRTVGVVFEESFLFSDSVRANIAYGRPDATDDEVEDAARAAAAHGFISELPEGYDTVVGERGLTLSGGQRQRIALARTLLTDPRVLILDDATSSVDATTEEEIQGALTTLLEGRTTILVAHRRSTLRLADRIVVVDGGRVVAEGQHEDLLATSALYRGLLAGPDDAIVEDAAAISEQVDGVTASAWQPIQTEEPVDRARLATGRIGPPGGGGRGTGANMNLTATPELLDRLEKLPAANDAHRVDLEAEATDDGTGRFRLSEFLKPYRMPLGIGLGLVFVDAILTLAGPILVRHAVDGGIQDASFAFVLGTAAVFTGVALADWFVMWASTLQTGLTAERLLLALRVRIFAHLQRLSVEYYDRELGGRIMTRMTTDVEALSSLLQTGLIQAVVSFFTFFGVLIVLMFVNWQLTLALMIVVPPLVLATWLFRVRSATAYDRARERIAAVNADLQENLSGVRVAQASAREDVNSAGFRRLSRQYLDARLDAQKLVALYFPFVYFLSAMADILVLGVGSGLVRNGALSAGALIAFILYVDLFFSPVQQLSQVFDTYQQADASMKRVNELMATPTATPIATAPVPLPEPLTGRVRFDDVHFRYPTATDEALRGIDLELQPGEVVALVGETGAGKSTIVKLIARFHDPTSGRVLIDGVPLTELDVDGYRQRLGYVPQEAFLFTGTIRDNIAFGRPDASDAAVEASARAVGAHDFITRLPGGYLHPVSERGRSLSAGERQLVCLARAHLVDPAILLLDEATANLDLATEAKVAQAMQVVSQGRVTVVIAHRLQTARSADRIAVMVDGRIAELGSHDQLLAREGAYASMWQVLAA